MNPDTIPKWHLEDVWERKIFQEWWKMSWDNEDGHRHHSNVNLGDCFSLGKCAQVGIVCGKVLHVGPGIEPEYHYQIAGNIGGHYRHPVHSKMFEGGYFLFIPSAEQLAATGHMEWAQRLIESYGKGEGVPYGLQK